ncbi:hypothetical protein FCY96_03130 [Escherichia coli]|nr:hypothetical protein [Escherichia coli]
MITKRLFIISASLQGSQEVFAQISALEKIRIFEYFYAESTALFQAAIKNLVINMDKTGSNNKCDNHHVKNSKINKISDTLCL